MLQDCHQLLDTGKWTKYKITNVPVGVQYINIMREYILYISQIIIQYLYQ